MNEREQKIAWLAYEVGFNDAYFDGLQSFCSTLVKLADEPTADALPTSQALRLIADSMREGGDLEYSLKEFPPSDQLRTRLFATIAHHLKKRRRWRGLV